MNRRLGIIDGKLVYAETRRFHIEQDLDREARALLEATLDDSESASMEELEAAEAILEREREKMNP